MSKLSHVRKSRQGVFSVKIVGGEGSDPPQAEITETRLDVRHESRTWKEAIICPKCATAIE